MPLYSGDLLFGVLSARSDNGIGNLYLSEGIYIHATRQCLADVETLVCIQIQPLQLVDDFKFPFIPDCHLPFRENPSFPRERIRIKTQVLGEPISLQGSLGEPLLFPNDDFLYLEKRFRTQSGKDGPFLSQPTLVI